MLSWAGARCGLYTFPKDTPPTDIMIICFRVVLGIPGVVWGLYRTTPDQPANMTTVSHFSLYGVVRGIVQGPSEEGCPGSYGRMFQTFACTGIVQGFL